MQDYGSVTIYNRHLGAEGIGWTRKSYYPFSVRFKNLLGHRKDKSYSYEDVTIRISSQKCICRTGDMLVFGICEKDEPPDDSLLVKKVTNSFKCSEYMKHVKIKAE